MRARLFVYIRLLLLLLTGVFVCISLNAQTIKKIQSDKPENSFHVFRKITGSDKRQEKKAKADFKKFITSHRYYAPKINLKEMVLIPKPDRPDLAKEQDFLRTLDPSLGYPPSERLIPTYNAVSSQLRLKSGPGSQTFPWLERGPSNVGGRTRTLMFDPNYPIGTKVWAGGVSGGLWSNDNITDPDASWINVDDFWSNIAITCIDYDPTNTQVFYVGTGELWGSSANKGAGIWKSTDGGRTWVNLPASANFFYVNDIRVRRENGQGVIYAAVSGYSMNAKDSIPPNLEGLFRSTDGGQNFTQVFPGRHGHPFAAWDIEIASNNRIWVGTVYNSYHDTSGKIFFSDNGTNWVFSDSISANGRVEIAVAPSNSNYIYAVYEDSTRVSKIRFTKNNGTKWMDKVKPVDADKKIPRTDFSRG